MKKIALNERIKKDLILTADCFQEENLEKYNANNRRISLHKENLERVVYDNI